MIIRKVKVTEYEYQAPINYVAGATEPDIQFQLTDYEIPSGATGRVYVGRSDGTFEYTVATISGNNVTVAPTSSMFSVKGPGAIQVTLYVGNEVVKNFAVPVYVHADLADDSAEAGSDVTGVFRAAEEEALADFQEQAEQIVDEVIEEIPADYTALTEEVSELNERMDTEGLSEDVKTALLTCFRHVAFLDDDADYYGALEDALYPYTGLVSISAVFSQGSAIIYNNAPLNDLKNYLTVIGHYADGTSKAETDYLLSGTLEVGTSTITVSKEGKTATFTVSVTKYPWDYEWTFTDGLLTDNGWTDISTDPGTATLVSDGLLIANEVSGAFSTNYAKDDFISDNIKAEYEIMFTNVYGVNDPRIILGLSINGATGLRLQLDESTAGVTEGTSVVTIPNTPFITNEWYKISSQLINGVASVAINDTTVYTSSNLATQYISKTNIAVVGGGSVKVKSIRYGRIS